MPSEVSVTPSCIAAMNRGGDSVIRSTCSRAGLLLLRELGDPRPPHGDEAVLRGDEEAVQQDQHRDGDELQEKCHAPLSGARVLERIVQVSDHGAV